MRSRVNEWMKQKRERERERERQPQLSGELEMACEGRSLAGLFALSLTNWPVHLSLLPGLRIKSCVMASYFFTDQASSVYPDPIHGRPSSTGTMRFQEGRGINSTFEP